jgi:hypothetical protein
MTNQELRAMVRDVLREALPQKGGAPSAVENVRIGTDGELDMFVRHVLERQDAIKAGQLRFTLGIAQEKPSGGGAVVTGVITEHVVNRYAGMRTMAIGPDAVVTPLARDRARMLNLRIERRR